MAGKKSFDGGKVATAKVIDDIKIEWIIRRIIVSDSFDKGKKIKKKVDGQVFKKKEEKTVRCLKKKETQRKNV